jgi:hypothetical protein
MALRGRKPKSLAEKRLTGNPGKRPLRPVVPEPPVGGDGLLCPVAVRDDPRAAAYWDMYLSSTAPGHLTSVDAPLLARLCVALALADAATAQVQALGLKAPNTGLPIQSPWVAVMNRQIEIARKLAGELALPPAQRGRVWAGPPPGAVPLPTDDEWPF